METLSDIGKPSIMGTPHFKMGFHIFRIGNIHLFSILLGFVLLFPVKGPTNISRTKVYYVNVFVVLSVASLL